MATENITVTRTVDAPVDKVWQAVSDVKAMGRRSPQCKKMLVLGKGQPSEGTVTLNLNRRGWMWWPTWSVITRWQPEKLLEFKIPLNTSRWRFELEPSADGSGTTITHSRIVKGNTTLLSRGMVAVALGGEQDFESELRAGMEETLAAIASEVGRQ
ncbi:MAG TPA: SRPBCC family protein [Candidatus Corynebacterium gallistercoris]|uniref:SRPBCC family protein n=1 Tax=Candidatus Corynebacterium gallistercoris TaxID=2838530 RepID=A0A9D1RXJ9_9CORY|nr:SRPBCC family protein [Candidatus Corynebacterium gallistercoris]